MAPWYSAEGSDFNCDFHVTLDESVAPVEYNFKDKAALLAAGETWFTQGEQPGLSAFVRDGETVFHTYSSYAEGTDLLPGRRSQGSWARRSAANHGARRTDCHLRRGGPAPGGLLLRPGRHHVGRPVCGTSGGTS